MNKYMNDIYQKYLESVIDGEKEEYPFKVIDTLKNIYSSIKRNNTLEHGRSIDWEGVGLIKLPDLSWLYLYGGFYCDNNKLTTLKGAPKFVRGYFDCSYNNLTTLEGAPKYVCGDFDCSYNNLTTLEGSPLFVGFDFVCSSCDLLSLKGSPKFVGGDFECIDNNSKTFSGMDCPSIIGGLF